MDGNRRWARAQGKLETSFGHRRGAEHLSSLLGWLVDRGIEHASVYVLSADNIRKRGAEEVSFLFTLIETIIPQRVRASGHWRLHVSGDLELLPASTRAALLEAMETTHERSSHLTLAIGYDAHTDILDAVRRTVVELSSGDDGVLSVDAISRRLAGGPNKEIDLIIRTGGENRTSGFFPWQSRAAELYVASCPWPDFAERDLDDAFAYYAARSGSDSS